MLLRKWEYLPPEMQNENVRKYYDILHKKRCSLFFKRLFDIAISFLLLIILSPLFSYLPLLSSVTPKDLCFSGRKE